MTKLRIHYSLFSKTLDELYCIMPKVSAIIPAYNRADFLPRSIGSVLNQTFRDLELIVVDDGSTDNTKAVVEEFARKDNRVKYFWQPNFGGPAGPRNTGIKHASGKYVAFLDSDDEWMPTKVEEQVNLFEHSAVDTGFAGCDYTLQEGATIVTYKLPRFTKDTTFEKLLEHDFIGTATIVMIKNDVLDDVGGFDENLECGEDTDLWLRIAEKYKFALAPNILAAYHVHGNNTLMNFHAIDLAQSTESTLKKYAASCEKYPRAYSVRLRQLAANYCAAGELTKGRNYYKQSIKLDPINLKGWASLFATFLLGKSAFFIASRLKFWLRQALRFKLHWNVMP